MPLNRIEKTRRELIKKGKKITNLSSGNPGEFGVIFPEKVLQKSFQKFLKNIKYTADPKGDFMARKAIVALYKKHGLQISPDQILLTSGTSESYFHLFKLLAARDETILFPNPSYPLCEEIARLAEIKISFYRLDESKGWQIDIKDLEEKILRSPKAIVLISPGNPTGAVLHEETLEKVLHLAEKNKIPLICDEVFSEFIFDHKKFPRTAKIAKNPGKNVDIFTLSGVSKTYALPGLKLGWIVVTGPNVTANIDKLERSTDALLATNQMSQCMLSEIIQSGGKFIKTFREKLELNRNMAIKILQQPPTKTSSIIFHKPEGGFYLFAKIENKVAGKTMNDEDFVIGLMEKTNIFVHPGYFYDYDDGVYILISLLMPKDKFKKCLEEIIEFIKNL